MAATPIKPVKRTVAAAAEKKPAKITIKETVNKAVKAAPKKTAAAKPKKVAGKGE